MPGGGLSLIIEAMQRYETHVTTDVGDRGQLIETKAAVRSLNRKIEETISQIIAEQTQKLAEIERKRDRLEQELIKAQSKTDRNSLRSPVDGTVQQLSVSTLGQVVASGQSLLTVVPLGGDRSRHGRQQGYRVCRAGAAGRRQGRSVPVHVIRDIRP